VVHPLLADQLTSANLCGSCHNILLPVFDWVRGCLARPAMIRCPWRSKGDVPASQLRCEVEHRAGASAISTGVLDRGVASRAQKR
jgi:hypothetical protein